MVTGLVGLIEKTGRQAGWSDRAGRTTELAGLAGLARPQDWQGHRTGRAIGLAGPQDWHVWLDRRTCWITALTGS